MLFQLSWKHIKNQLAFFVEDNQKKKNNYFFYYLEHFRNIWKHIVIVCSRCTCRHITENIPHKLGGLLSDLMDLWLVITFLTLFVNPYIILRLVSFYLLTLRSELSDIKWWTVFVQHTATRATSLLNWRCHCLQRLPPL